MSSLVSFFLPYILLYTYAALFCIVFSAAIILPIPVSILLLAVGAFVSHGYFNFWTALAVAVSANVMGDTADYLLARWKRHAILSRLHIDRVRSYERIREYLRANAGRTVFITRFGGSLDPITNFLAGFTGVHPFTFVSMSILGNGLQIASVLALGYFVGDYWQSFSGPMSTAGGIIAVLIVMYALFKMYRNMAGGSASRRPKHE